MLPLFLKPSLLVSSGSQILRRRLSNLSFHASLCSRTTHSEAEPDRSNWHCPDENFPIRLFPNQYPYGHLRRSAGWCSYCLDFVLSNRPHDKQPPNEDANVRRGCDATISWVSNDVMETALALHPRTNQCNAEVFSSIRAAVNKEQYRARYRSPALRLLFVRTDGRPRCLGARPHDRLLLHMYPICGCNLRGFCPALDCKK